MKLIFSLFIGMTISTYASAPLVLITYEGSDRNYISQVENIMKNQFKIGKDLYRIENTPCIQKESIATHICIDKNKNIKTIYRNNEVMEEMLGVYWK